MGINNCVECKKIIGPSANCAICPYCGTKKNSRFIFRMWFQPWQLTFIELLILPVIPILILLGLLIWIISRWI